MLPRRKEMKAESLAALLVVLFLLTVLALIAGPAIDQELEYSRNQLDSQISPEQRREIMERQYYIAPPMKN
jgi:Tfp pilus assembly protein FimT